MRAGAEVIKVMATGNECNDFLNTHTSMGELKVIVEEAGTRGLKTMAHAHGAEGIKMQLWQDRFCRTYIS